MKIRARIACRVGRRIRTPSAAAFLSNPGTHAAALKKRERLFIIHKHLRENEKTRIQTTVTCAPRV